MDYFRQIGTKFPAVRAAESVLTVYRAARCRSAPLIPERSLGYTFGCSDRWTMNPHLSVFSMQLHNITYSNRQCQPSRPMSMSLGPC